MPQPSALKTTLVVKGCVLAANTTRAWLFVSEDRRFAIEMLRNLAWFCVIALAALLLHNFVRWVQEHAPSIAVAAPLSWVEHAIFVSDVVWFLSRLIVSTFHVVLSTYHEIALTLREYLKAPSTGNSSKRSADR
jgi:hypothetical protein